MFRNFQVTADAVYGEADDGRYRLLGFTGQCGNVKHVVSTSDMLLTEKVTVGKKKFDIPGVWNDYRIFAE